MVDIVSLLISWLVPSLVAAVAIMLSSGIIEHNLEFKHAIIMGLVANIIPSLMNSYLSQLYSWIPYGYMSLGPMTLASAIVNLLLWIGLAAIIMSEAEKGDRLKIGVLGFIITEILMFVMPLFVPAF